MNVKPLDLEKLAKDANNSTNEIEGEETNYFWRAILTFIIFKTDYGVDQIYKNTWARECLKSAPWQTLDWTYKKQQPQNTRKVPLDWKNTSRKELLKILPNMNLVVKIYWNKHIG